jgi:hypothetical protein
MAFMMCLARADKYMREHAGLKEVATVVAEDVPEMRTFLKSAPTVLRDNPTISRPQDISHTVREKELGYRIQESDWRATRIRRSIHFVGKEEDPLLQLSDACAFGLRRYFAEQQFGNDFANSILGFEPVLEDFSNSASAYVFHQKTKE